MSSIVRSCKRPCLNFYAAHHDRSRQRTIRCRATQTSVIERRHILPDKVELEVLVQTPIEKSDKPPLLFLHGSWHGAWCWKENFLPYFAEQGYPSYALSFRGHGKSDQSNLKISGTLESHADDVNDFARTLPNRPIIIGHSFAGLFVQYICLNSMEGDYSGAVTLCSTPPSGNIEMSKRFIQRDFINAIKITWGLVTRRFKQDKALCKFLFFSDDIPEQTFERYHAQLAACGPTTIVDVAKVNKYLPLSPLGTPIPSLVLGAENDNIIDKDAVQETAQWFNTKFTILPNTCHDAMLDTRWEQTANHILRWVENLTEKN